jgi:hypothetical protein
MTSEAEVPPARAETPPRLPDLLGFAYLAVMGAVMTAWMGALAWMALAALNWLAS